MGSIFSVSRMARLAVLGVGMAAMVMTSASAVSAQSAKGLAQLSLVGGLEIGLTARDLTDSDVSREKLAGRSGAVVDEVRADSPAGKAGFRAGDVVLTFDGERVRSARHLARLVEETPEGREVEAAVMRGGQQVTLRVAPQAAGAQALRGLLGSRGTGAFALRVPDDLIARLQPGQGPLLRKFPFALGTARLGVAVQELTSQLREYFGAETGVLVTSVEAGTPASSAGVRAGDVITKVNGQPVGTAVELRQRLADASGEITITVVRDRKEQTLKATLPASGARPVKRLPISA
jgi:S1-C subfamily serine protease